MSNSSLRRYHVRLESPVSTGFRCTRAANSLDIDPEKKSVHEFSVEADLESDFSVGLIVGASGSGKTTLARQIFSDEALVSKIKMDLPIIEQFPKEWSYDDCANALSGMGLTSVPCWIRPVYTLSNGQRARAEAALGLAFIGNDGLVIDEWTSVVDRTVAKVMSHCVQKYARSQKKKIILLSCHYDVAEWLSPDWIIDCNEQKFIDRRAARPDRSEQLTFEIRKTDKSAWSYFSKYHYLSEKLPAGHNHFWGLFQGENQIGFGMFSNYVPRKPGTKMIYHSNRVVIHPDFAGLGLGLKFVNETAKLMIEEHRCQVYATFSSIPMYKARLKDWQNWEYMKTERRIGQYKKGGNINRNAKGISNSGYRENVKLFSFKFIGHQRA